MFRCPGRIGPALNTQVISIFGHTSEFISISLLLLKIFYFIVMVLLLLVFFSWQTSCGRGVTTIQFTLSLSSSFIICKTLIGGCVPHCHSLPEQLALGQTIHSTLSPLCSCIAILFNYKWPVSSLLSLRPFVLAVNKISRLNLFTFSVRFVYSKYPLNYILMSIQWRGSHCVRTPAHCGCSSSCYAKFCCSSEKNVS